MAVFFKAGDNPVGGLFIGLACVYVAEFFATLAPDVPAFPPGASSSLQTALSEISGGRHPVKSGRPGSGREVSG
jgi:hypothetical protein